MDSIHITAYAIVAFVYFLFYVLFDSLIIEQLRKKRIAAKKDMEASWASKVYLEVSQTFFECSKQFPIYNLKEVELRREIRTAATLLWKQLSPQQYGGKQNPI